MLPAAFFAAKAAAKLLAGLPAWQAARASWARISSAISTSSSASGRSQWKRVSLRRSWPWPGCSRGVRTSSDPGDQWVRYLEENVAPAGIDLTTDDLTRIEAAVPKGGTAGERHPDVPHRTLTGYPAAFSALGTVSFGDTLYQASRICPSSPIRNDERMIPMYLRP